MPQLSGPSGRHLSAGETVTVGRHQLRLPDFLREVADHLEGTRKAPDTGLPPVADRFLGGGLTALRTAGAHTWLEYRLLTPPHSRTQPALYSALRRTACELLDEGQADDFYFVHKSPGLRVRFHTSTARREPAESHLLRTWNDWQRDGLISGIGHAVYEPEQHLFGGPDSMLSVHRVFTADSLAWLSHLSSEKPTAPAWALSMSMIRILFTGLRIADFEDRDVWDRTRRQVGRRFEGAPPEHWPATSARLNRIWHSPQHLGAVLGPAHEPVLAQYRESIERTCDRWRDTYFTVPGAQVGPREAAAFLIVFHWNRARLPKDWQIGISEALAHGTSEEPDHDQ
ncbi:thiopeptide-type bacteriocin biosynthesis protein [Kitasatospora sp. NPDC096077]|uniref:thiopeptide-type bacteriocin biosynthesis protein n=1 Tax=Kitasatospora sp. NPDC096077 TaxID=3155544 RepID=UPI003328F725